MSESYGSLPLGKKFDETKDVKELLCGGFSRPLSASSFLGIKLR